MEGAPIPFNHRVVTVNSHRSVIVRDIKDENLPVQLFLALHRPRGIRIHIQLTNSNQI